MTAAKIFQKFESELRNSGALPKLLRLRSAYFKVLASERRLPGSWSPPLTGREMSATTPGRIALVVFATAGLLFFAVMLLTERGHSGSGVAVIGPVGIVIMGVFATACA